MASDKRVKITLSCTECKQRNYNTIKNKKNDPDRLEMNKYCRFCKKHTGPQRSELINYSVVVLAFMVAMGIVIFAIDAGAGALVKLITR